MEPYKEWRREVKTLTYLHDMEDHQVAGLLYLALEPGPGKPRGLFTVWEIPEDLQKTGALTDMWKILDSEYTRQDYVQSDQAQARFLRCRRMPGQKMED